MSTKKHPLDFGALCKGTWLETAELIDATRTPSGPLRVGSNAWNFALLGLCSQIENESEILCRIDHDRIRLMTDVEADEYTTRRAMDGARTIRNQYRKRALIRTDAMLPDERRLSEARDRVVYALAESTRRQAVKGKRLLALLQSGEAPDPEST